MSYKILRGFVPIGLSGLIGAAAFVLLGLIAAPTTQAGDPCYHGQVIPSRTDAAETQIKVGPCFFGPTVVAGTGFGILVGAAGLWIATRVTRRRPTENGQAD